jgi:hypothetical protein
MIRVYLYQRSFLVCFLGLIMCNLFAGISLASHCPKSSKDSNSYQWRDNRCEGLVPYKISGEPFLISFAVKNISQFSNDAEIQVRGYSSSNLDYLQVQSYLSQDYYLLNHFNLKENGSFQWSAHVLKKLNIQPKNLWLLASAKMGNESKYLPIQIGSSASTYEFAFISNDEVTFTKVQIMSGNKLVKKLNFVRAAQPARQPIIFRWDGKDTSGKKSPSGSYRLVYEALSQQDKQSPIHVEGSPMFEHDVAWLSP